MIVPNAFVNGDCMDYLKEYPDNYFDLAVVDPPYGDGGDKCEAYLDAYKKWQNVTVTP